MDSTNLSVLFYDGDCGLCSRTVQFILKHEKKDSDLRFASLTDSRSSDFFKEKNWPQIELNTIYVFHNNRLEEKSKAAFVVSSFLKSPYSWLQIFKVIPAFIANFVYDFIAKRRHKFGKNSCIFDSSFKNRQLFQ